MWQISAKMWQMCDSWKMWQKYDIWPNEDNLKREKVSGAGMGNAPMSSSGLGSNLRSFQTC